MVVLLARPALDDVRHVRAEGPGSPEISVTGTVFAMIVQGAKRLDYGGHGYDYGVGEYLVASVELPPLIEREVVWLLMTGEHGAAVRQLGLADSRLSRIRNAVHWIREHYAESLRIDDLARMSAMSASAFHRAFAAVTTTSPLRFQKQIRLQEARARLIADPGDVAGTAYAVGYESPSQFSREYRRQFGLPPARDAVRMRGRPAAA